MKRLVKLVLVTGVKLAVLCVAAVVVGRGQGNAFPELKRCGEKPCYSEIVVGETPLDQALTTLRASTALKETKPDGAEVIFVHSAPDYNVRLLASGGTVAGFSIGEFKPPFTLMDILSRLGRPCSVFSDYGSPGYQKISYPDIGFYIQAMTDKVRPDSPVFSIFTRGYDQDDCPPEQQLNHATITGSSHAWRGLGEFYGWR